MKWKLSASLMLCTSLSALCAFAQEEEPTPPPPAYGEEPATQPQPAAAPPADLPPPPQLEPASPYAPAPPDAVPAGAERHDGFFLRIGLGVGGMAMERSTEGRLYGQTQPGQDSSVSGPAGMFELSIGGTPAAGLVVAGTILSHSMADPTLEFDGGGEAELGGPLLFAMIGATVDWYPNPQKGFHFGGTLGPAFAVAETPEGAVFDNIGGAGIGLSALVGYDWWVSDEWSLGVLGRLSGARVRGEASERVGGTELEGEEDSSVAAIGVLFSILHH
ncbi:MAG TPA: hypothetical protein VK524_27130 [Polyangiaceae bacterium]|nr:hypothetical protein [Polyangiaceae bacterium]